ncbi:hypothetical protein BX659_13536 [Orenia metallireducens]|uniref:Uncharacterized protein n=2 Tax=Orenia metallireducens TaxID=1413210 RepID=A0A285IBG3_9FIRM|nr:hypothetical protein [Orenia metallireducens]PRX20636.1 hypothetical protein BX659_13536 [Orenia metallireducens]SNY45308.1 hypothetical protein SAMN06265827_13737 [Orenia metallireducens]
MLKKYLGLFLLISGIFSILSGFIFMIQNIDKYKITIEYISVLINTLILGIPLIIYSMKFIGIKNWKSNGGTIILIIGGLYLICLLLTLLCIKDIPENLLLTQGGITLVLLIYGIFLKKNSTLD